jgi:phage shock protein A
LGKKTLKDEFAELEAGGKIDSELEALKKKMQAKTEKPAAKVKKS